MKDIHKATTSALLPQYSHSPAFEERFLVAIHEEGAEVARSKKNNGFQLVDYSEIVADSFEYFITNKESLEIEFFSDLCQAIGKHDAQIFCEVISVDWFLGGKLRDRVRVNRLKASISEYLSKLLGNLNDVESVVQNPELPADVEPLLSVQQIAAILTLNDRMMHRHIEEWKSQHSNCDSISTDNIFLRRGLYLDREINISAHYKEWDYINSYSIAFSASEKFTQIKAGKIQTIINGDLALFSGRMLFFSPFIPKMEVGQLEVGVIPGETPLPLYFQGKHGGILEYILDPTPVQLGKF